MIGNFFKWFVDPKAQGRKRSVFAVLTLFALSLHAIDAQLHDQCSKAILQGSVCSIEADMIGGDIDAIVDFGKSITENPKADAAAAVFGLWAVIDGRKKARVAKRKAAALATLLLLALLTSPVSAQTRHLSLALETGIASTWTERVKDERAGVILSADVPVKRGGWLTRIDIAGSRGQQAVDLTNPNTFRSTEMLTALYYEARGGVDAICFGGVSYSIEGTEGRPADGRMYTGGCGLRVRALDQSLIFGYGKRGSINGQGFLGSLTVKKTEKARLHLDGALASRRGPTGGHAWELRSIVTYVPWSHTSKQP